jgi:energy-coupling factor transporter transmembrane protein EcfT
MILALFAFGTLWFWLLTFVLFVTLVFTVNASRGFLSTSVFVFTLLFLNYVAKVPVFALAFYHPWAVLLLLGLYCVAGTIWCFLKWYLFVKDLATQYARSGTLVRMSPQVSDYKSDILFWLSYWPFSILGYMLNDFVRKVFNSIYNEIADKLQGISDRVFSSRIRNTN